MGPLILSRRRVSAPDAFCFPNTAPSAMNRIYQGRVSLAELIDEKGNLLPAPPNWKGTDALWNYHVLFQDGVNLN